MSLVLLMVGMAVVGPLVWGGPTRGIDVTRAFLPPALFGGDWDHPLGTDQLGRDLLANLLLGARISLLIAVSSVVCASVIGMVVGLVSGSGRGWVDAIASRVMDAQLSLPFILMALVVVVSFGPSLVAIVIVVAVTSWVPYARLVRAEVQLLRRSDFVALAIVSGLPRWRIVVRHFVPNVLPSVLVLISLQVGQAILYESSLSFLGLGVQPPTVSWGVMIAESRLYLGSAPWLVIVPGVALALTILAANLVGDRVRDRLDPTSGVTV